VSHAPSDARPELRVRTVSAAGTRSFGAWLAAVALPGDRIALTGTLGAGKTQLAKGFAAGLGVREVVSSPSFTHMAEYEGRLPLFHQDLYRLDDAADAYAGGLLDERQDLGVTLAEWADRLGDSAGSDRLELHLVTPVTGAAGLVAEAPGDTPDGVPDEPREIVLRAPSAYARYLERAAAWPGEDAP
jgi:tRNA threonylcarbamoyladenosine biosynthesis protein TsaE